MIFFAPTATVMFGALLVCFVCGVLGIAGGLAMQGNSKARRGLLILASLLALMELPLGVALGTYTLIVVLPNGQNEKRASELDSDRPALSLVNRS